jgi:hypothetical protein
MDGKEKKSGFGKFLRENRSLVITIPVFIVLVVVVILVYVFMGNNDKPEDQTAATPTPAATEQPAEATPAPTQPASDSSGTEVTTLPQDERDKDESEIMRNPFADPYRVSGIIYDKKGGSIAIIEAENKTFIVEADDQVGEYFKVLNIESDRVVLEIEGQEIVLTLSGE